MIELQQLLHSVDSNHQQLRLKVAIKEELPHMPHMAENSNMRHSSSTSRNINQITRLILSYSLSPVAACLLQLDNLSLRQTKTFC